MAFGKRILKFRTVKLDNNINKLILPCTLHTCVFKSFVQLNLKKWILKM